MKEMTLCAVPMSCCYQKCHLLAADAFSTSENASLRSELCVTELWEDSAPGCSEQGQGRLLSPGAARNGQTPTFGTNAVY